MFFLFWEDGVASLGFLCCWLAVYAWRCGRSIFGVYVNKELLTNGNMRIMGADALEDEEVRDSYSRWCGIKGVYELVSSHTGEVLGEISGSETCVFNLGVAKRVIEEIMNGRTIKEIISGDNMPTRSQLWLWRRMHPLFDEQIRYARRAFAESCHDELKELSDELRAGGLSRVDVESKTASSGILKWLSEKNNREDYGVDRGPALGGGVGQIVINTGVPVAAGDVVDVSSVERGESDEVNELV